ncbi:MAG: cyclodeaminase/cyclohydrolase family protein [Phycisphaerales bacterium]|jgi:formiminotetrahydrofolate cyclodeaminase|nr:cyclodeaminase/cyclohydrolase family protein [Phycisphaerales bacterium]
MTIGEQTFNAFLDDLASKEPIPGGGATSGILAALASSLGAMVLAYTKGKEKYAQHESFLDDCGNFLNTARIEAMELAAADAAAYGKLHALWKLDKEDPNRVEQWGDAVELAIDVPIRTMELCIRILTTLEAMLGKTNKMLVSDLATSAIIANAAAETASWTGRINLPMFDDELRKTELSEKIETLLRSSSTLAKGIDASCRSV